MTVNTQTPPKYKVEEIVPDMIWRCASAIANPDQLLESLSKDTLVAQKIILVNKVKTKVPRLGAFYGDEEIKYYWEGTEATARPWSDTLQGLGERLNMKLGMALNACMVTVFRNGEDYTDWYSDDSAPVNGTIVMVHLGAIRQIQVRSKNGNFLQTFNLQNGDLLMMKADIQSAYEWCAPQIPSVPGKTVLLRYIDVTTPKDQVQHNDHQQQVQQEYEDIPGDDTVPDYGIE